MIARGATLAPEEIAHNPEIPASSLPVPYEDHHAISSVPRQKRL
jgi:hypothetical protein